MSKEMEDGPITEENHPEPISEQELQMALMLTKGRFPNCEFVIRKYIEQLKKQADEINDSLIYWQSEYFRLKSYIKHGGPK